MSLEASMTHEGGATRRVTHGDTLIALPLPRTDDGVRTLLTQVSPLLTTPDTNPDFEAKLFSLAALHQIERLCCHYAPLDSA